MAHVSKVPVSRVIKEDEEPEAASRSRGDYKKMRELEEARKSGSEPAAVDEFGKDINPHIPQYISEAPWYLDPKVSFKGPVLSIKIKAIIYGFMIFVCESLVNRKKFQFFIFFFFFF